MIFLITWISDIKVIMITKLKQRNYIEVFYEIILIDLYITCFIERIFIPA